MISILLLATQLMLGGENVEKYVPEEKSIVTNSIVQEKELKPSDFPRFINGVDTPLTAFRVHIESESDMSQFVSRLFTELPTSVTLVSNKYTPKELRDMWYKAEESVLADDIPEVYGLAYYRSKQIGKTLRLRDETHKQYRAIQVKLGVEGFVKELAPTLKRKTDIETIRAISDYLYSNFRYDASNIPNMRVGNLGASALACNGLSYLADKLLEANGLTSEIRGGESHYWNIVTLKDGQQITFDVTSDIVLKEKFLTLGLSTKDHIDTVARINFYSAKYDETKYKPVTEYKLIRE